MGKQVGQTCIVADPSRQSQKEEEDELPRAVLKEFRPHAGDPEQSSKLVLRSDKIYLFLICSYTIIQYTAAPVHHMYTSTSPSGQANAWANAIDV